MMLATNKSPRIAVASLTIVCLQSFLLVGVSGQENTFSDSSQAYHKRVVLHDDEALLQKRRLLQQQLAQIGLPELSIQPSFPQQQQFVSGSNAYLFPAVDRSYALGAGDEVGVFILGEMQKEFTTTIHSDGSIYLPPAGMIFLQGLSIPTAQQEIEALLKKYYKNIRVDLTVLRARQVQVEVLGEVFAPGAYVVSSVQSLFDVFARAGGLTPQGSWRDIVLQHRDGKRQKLDLYPALFDSAATDPVVLQSGMKIFVMPQRYWLAVQGEILRPGVFQLPADGSEALARVIRWAGGFLPSTDTSFVQVSRRQRDGGRVQRIVDPGQSRQDDAFELQHGDIVQFSRRVLADKKSEITVWGEVLAPGKLIFSQGMRLSDAIRMADGLQRDADLLVADITHVRPVAKDVTSKVSLQEALAQPHTAADPELGPDDQIFVRQIPNWRLGMTVRVSGEILYPGRYPIEKDSTRLSEIIRLAGGPTKEALLHGTRITRRNRILRPGEDYVRLSKLAPEQMSRLEYESFLLQADLNALDELVVDMEGVLAGKALADDPVLEPDDVIEIPPLQNLVYVAGRVGRPGAIPFRSNANVSYYLQKAGGTTWDAAKSKTKIVRVSGKVIESDKVHLPERGDVIWVPRKDDRTLGERIRETIAVIAQLATIYLVIDRARR